MSELPKPYELLDITDGGMLRFGVLKYEMGEMAIVARHSGEAKVVPVLRVWVRPGDKTHGMPYWDITSLTLQAQIKPYLDNPATKLKTFTVRAAGVRPVKRFQLEAA